MEVVAVSLLVLACGDVEHGENPNQKKCGGGRVLVVEEQDGKTYYSCVRLFK